MHTTVLFQLEQGSAQAFGRGDTPARHRLPEGWRQTLEPQDQDWVAEAVWVRQERRLWHHPPEAGATHPSTRPVVGRYFTRRLLLWAPARLWKVKLDCPTCTSPKR